MIGLYQELSQVDSSATKPADSSYITSMKAFALEARTNVNNMVNNVTQTRSDAIQVIMDIVDIERCSGGVMFRRAL